MIDPGWAGIAITCAGGLVAFGRVMERLNHIVKTQEHIVEKLEAHEAEDNARFEAQGGRLSHLEGRMEARPSARAHGGGGA